MEEDSELVASPAVWNSSDDDTLFTKQSGAKYDSKHDSDVDLRMDDNVDAPYGVDLDSDVDMDRDGHNQVDDEEEEDYEDEDWKQEERMRRRMRMRMMAKNLKRLARERW